MLFHPDNQIQPTFQMTPGFKFFLSLHCLDAAAGPKYIQTLHPREGLQCTAFLWYFVVRSNKDLSLVLLPLFIAEMLACLDVIFNSIEARIVMSSLPNPGMHFSRIVTFSFP